MVDLCHILPIFTESKISTILLCAPGFQGAAEENLVVREKQQPSAAAATSTVEDSNVCETLVAAVALTELNHSLLCELNYYKNEANAIVIPFTFSQAQLK